MNRLVDTNIFLEIFLNQSKSQLCKQFLNKHIGSIYISDFSLHSIGVILFKHDRHDAFSQFLLDILPKIKVVSLPESSYTHLAENSLKYKLDFDDAYQFTIASEYSFIISTMDQDFKKVQSIITVDFL